MAGGSCDEHAALRGGPETGYENVADGALFAGAGIVPHAYVYGPVEHQRGVCFGNDV